MSGLMARRYAVLAILLASLAWPADAAADNSPDTPSRCNLAVQNGGFGGQTGILVDGHCVPITQTTNGGGPAPVTRQVDCGQPPNQRTDSASRNQADNISRWNYADCGSTILACQQPATNGGAPIPVNAFVTQTRDAATGRWTSSAAWCPATTTAIPGTALLHEQALRLLPHVMIGTTGNAISLVNIQTILWARTTAARDLGQVTILGQPVWLRLALDHANWGFGDDTSDVTTSPGKAFDPARSDCATVLCPGYFGHVYTGAGTKTVSLTIAWIASFSLDGRSYQPIGTSAMVGPEATVSLTLRQSRGVLVTGPEAR